MKIAHISDLHCNRENAEAALKSLTEFHAHISSKPVDIVAISGDIWDASMLNTEASGFDRFVEAIQRIADIAPVVMVYGTPSHDTDGSLEVFKRVQSRRGITVLEPGTPYFLDVGIVRNKSTLAGSPGSLLILGIPEPRKKYLLAGATTGKDATDEAVRAAMHQLCFQLAAVRSQYADLPCLVVYHGDVAGTTLQNDETVERGTGIAITIDELADIGADYVACGHIHKPQQIGTLPAYYAGSAYPKNFGEGHKAGFNVATVGQDGTAVERVDFSHPQNLKIATKYPFTMFDAERFYGIRLWVEISCKKEEQALVDADKVLATIMKVGAAPGSRVTVSVQAVETVRADEITGAVSPEKKLEIWGEQSKITITDSLKAKLKTLEDKRETAGAVTSGDWALVSLRLRGSIGIKKGVKKDEIFINFDTYEPGLIALSGKNGKGKTTLIENCHAYPQLLTRKGTLKDHFFLRDSIREVIYRDQKTGAEKRYLIQIDGATKSGGSKYYIFDRAGSGSDWAPAAGIDGNLVPYTEAVEQTFGPMELFLRTAFTTQRANKDVPDLTEATKGEKKALFTNLAGIDYLQKFADNAKTEGDRVQAESHDAEIKIGVMEASVGKKEEIVNLIGNLRSVCVVKSVDLQQIQNQGTAEKSKVEILRKGAEAERARVIKENNLNQSINDIEFEIGGLKSDIGSFEVIAANRTKYEADITRYDDAKRIETVETEKLRAVEQQNLTKTTEFRTAMDTFNTEKRRIENLLNTARLGANNARGDAAKIQHSIELLKHEAADFDQNCPTCGQILPADKLAELIQKRDTARTRIETLQVEALEQNSAIAAQDASVDALQAELAGLGFDEPEAEKPEEFDRAILDGALQVIRSIEIDSIRALLTKSAESAARIEGFRAQIADKTKLQAEKQVELIEVQALANTSVIVDLKTAEDSLTTLTEQYRTLTVEIAAADASLKAQDKALADIAAQEAELEALRKQILTAKTEFAEWDLLKRAFGPDGIQALELDALAPGIADTANRILSSAYGDRFRVEFQTTRIGGTGKNTKQIEDFLIYIIDSEDGEQTLLENKSGGEAVWVKRAIYDAFAVIRARNTDFRFLTCFQDETDGALDSDSKTAYARMLEAAHAEGKLRHTIVITHSDEVKAMIAQKIEMEAFAGIAEPVEAQETEFALEAAV